MKAHFKNSREMPGIDQVFCPLSLSDLSKADWASPLSTGNLLKGRVKAVDVIRLVTLITKQHGVVSVTVLTHFTEQILIEELFLIV